MDIRFTFCPDPELVFLLCVTQCAYFSQLVNGWLDCHCKRVQNNHFDSFCLFFNLCYAFRKQYLFYVVYFF